MSVEIEAPGTWIRCGSSAVGVLGDVQSAGVALVAVTAASGNEAGELFRSMEVPNTRPDCTPAVDEPLCYSDSAKGLAITERRAVTECAAHCITDPSDVAELLDEARLAPGVFDAYRLLVALGY
jgi:hypothetical protein